jgi:hypothetical protein
VFPSVRNRANRNTRSKGLGRIQRRIDSILAASPEDAFSVEDLCKRIYETEVVEKRHRVAVLRAGKGLLKKGTAFHRFGSSRRGGLVFFNQGSVMSYGIARLKARDYRPSRIRKGLAPGGLERQYIEEGAVWWLAVQEWIAQNTGDTAKLEELKPMRDAQNQKFAAMIALCRP